MLGGFRGKETKCGNRKIEIVKCQSWKRQITEELNKHNNVARGSVWMFWPLPSDILLLFIAVDEGQADEAVPLNTKRDRWRRDDLFRHHVLNNCTGFTVYDALYLSSVLLRQWACNKRSCSRKRHWICSKVNIGWRRLQQLRQQSLKLNRMNSAKFKEIEFMQNNLQISIHRLDGIICMSLRNEFRAFSLKKDWV